MHQLSIMVLMGCSCGEAWLYSLCGTQSGAGFDASQVKSFLRVCHQLLPWEEICGARDKATYEAQTSSILTGLFSHIGGQGGVPSFWSRGPDCQARPACVPSKCVPSLLPAQQPLPQGDKRSLCMLGKGGNLQAGCWQRSTLPAMYHLCQHQQ